MPVHLDFDEEWLRDYCRRTGQEYPEEAAPRKKPRAKFGNRKTEADGRTYDSAREAKRHNELKLLQKSGGILAWAEQVPFLLPGGIRYIADFVILQKDGTWRVEDSKGFRTKEYRLKKRLMADMGIEIQEI